MCFKKPKPPPASSTGQAIADPALYRERVQAEEDNAILKAENKQRRMEDQLALLQGRIGRASLFSGGRGGRGFLAPIGKSLFVQNPRPGTGNPGPGSGPGRGPRPPRPQRPPNGGGRAAHEAVKNMVRVPRVKRG